VSEGEPLARVDKPWGYEEILERNDAFVVKRILLRRGERSSLQLHRVKQEWVQVRSGVADLLIGDDPERLERRRLGEGDWYQVPPETIHRVDAITDCLLLEVCTPHDDDIVRLQDDYGR
jgi:mannose-6-phosphate isomerase